jgi:hypothetical protein
MAIWAGGKQTTAAKKSQPSVRSNTNVLQDESRPRSPIQTAGSKLPAFSFIFKRLCEFESLFFEIDCLGKFYELIIVTM